MHVKVFLCHAHEDKDVVEPIGSWLHKRGFDVWIDNWRMTAGDSLVEKIGEGIESSDRLVVFLSAASVESKWVRKEVATGVIMELAEEKGFGEKFVIPALLTPCKVPILLRDKLYANFTNKAFEAACEELARGIRDEATGPQDKKLENRIMRHWNVPGKAPGKHGLIVEFAVRISPTEGLHVGIDVGAPYDTVNQWFGVPNQPKVPDGGGGVFTDSAERRDPPIYARKFSSPGVTSTRSYYWYFEGPSPFEIKQLQFLDFYDREP
jgi:hypothetical protein